MVSEHIAIVYDTATDSLSELTSFVVHQSTPELTFELTSELTFELTS